MADIGNIFAGIQAGGRSSVDAYLKGREQKTIEDDRLAAAAIRERQQQVQENQLAVGMTNQFINYLGLDPNKRKAVGPTLFGTMEKISGSAATKEVQKYIQGLDAEESRVLQDFFNSDEYKSLPNKDKFDLIQGFNSGKIESFTKLKDLVDSRMRENAIESVTQELTGLESVLPGVDTESAKDLQSAAKVWSKEIGISRQLEKRAAELTKQYPEAAAFIQTRTDAMKKSRLDMFKEQTGLIEKQADLASLEKRAAMGGGSGTAFTKNADFYYNEGINTFEAKFGRPATEAEKTMIRQQAVRKAEEHTRSAISSDATIQNITTAFYRDPIWSSRAGTPEGKKELARRITEGLEAVGVNSEIAPVGVSTAKPPSLSALEEINRRRALKGLPPIGGK